MTDLCETWDVDQTQVLATGVRFFNQYKKLTNQTKSQEQTILSLQVKYMLSSSEPEKIQFTRSDSDSPTLFISFMPKFAADLKTQEKGLIFVGNTFVMGLIGNSSSGELVDKLEALCKKMSKKQVKVAKKTDVKFDFKIKG